MMIHQAIKDRLPADQFATKGPVKLRPVTYENGWIGAFDQFGIRGVKLPQLRNSKAIKNDRLGYITRNSLMRGADIVLQPR